MPGTIKNGKICHHRTKLSEEFCRKEFIEPTEELEKVVFVPDVRSGLITTYGNVYFVFSHLFQNISTQTTHNAHILLLEEVYSENSKTFVVIWNPSSRKVGIMITTYGN